MRDQKCLSKRIVLFKCGSLYKTIFCEIINGQHSYFIMTCRNGKPEEMAGSASFLASDDSSYITGENIVASGGLQSAI
jgi:NAD(P)-dependent dehydrogenase (short-subunit alcohol dehydrogenase family)